MWREIERKWLISEENLPKNYITFPSLGFLQWYTTIAENADETRIRKEGYDYFLTVKKGEGKIRWERPASITKGIFDALWPSTEWARVEKTRYTLPYNNEKKIELDKYSWELAWLLLAEVEFKTNEESNIFVVPEWFGREVTEDKRYKNQNLARFWIPQD